MRNSLIIRDVDLKLFNYLEALLWFVISFVMGLRLISSNIHPSAKKSGGIVALAFFIFAISDLVEVRTGAWWKPWWLFLMKAICVCVFLWGYIQWSMYRKKSMEGKSSMDDSKQE